MSNVVLEHQSISRRHAALVWRAFEVDGGAQGVQRNLTPALIDLGSAHGVAVDGVRIAARVPTPLHAGATVTFGASTPQRSCLTPSATSSPRR